MGDPRVSVMEVDLRYLSREKSRHGKPRLYVRRNGRRKRVLSAEGTAAFAREYATAVDELSALKRPSPAALPSLPAPKTLGWLAMKYFASDEFAGLDATMQRRRRAVIEECLRERLNDGAPEVFRDCPLSVIGPEHIKRLRDLKPGKPGAANNRRKYLSSMYGWAIEDHKMRSNPCRDVRRVKYASEGFHTWSVTEVKQFQDRWPIGTKPRLALELLLLTGARRGDMVTFGRQMIENGWLRYVPRKTRYRRMDPSFKPLLPRLADVISRSPTGDLTFLVTSFGKPFTPAGFSNWFRDRCDEAGLPHCSAHGLRKAGATMAAELGATEQQLMAIFDWSTPAQAAVYTRAANRRKLAGNSMGLLASGSE
jgi:integrase